MARLLAAVAVLGLVLAEPAMAQSTYSQWNDPDGSSSGDGHLQDFVDRLNALIDKAEEARAADPNFLRDLRDLAAGHDRPWRVRQFDDDFLDGNHTDAPAWRVISGKYWVERGWGLRSSLAGDTGDGEQQGSEGLSSEQRAAQIFGQILGQVLNKGQATQTSPSATTAPGEAVIVADARISNAFAFDMEVSSWSNGGGLLVGIFQGRYQGARTPGYQLAYTPGGTFSLQRVGRRGTRTIETAGGPYPLEDKKIHRILWERQADGRMTVSVDGTKVFETLDRGFRDAFDGLALANAGGDYIVKRVTVMGAP